MSGVVTLISVGVMKVTGSEGSLMQRLSQPLVQICLGEHKCLFFTNYIHYFLCSY